MVLPRFELFEPAALEDALEILARRGTEAAVLAGGTDLVVSMKKGLKAPAAVVSLSRVNGLDRIAEEDGWIVIGPLVTMAALCRSELVQRRLPILADGAASVAAPLIRNRATVGGNLCNARPCADTAPPLMALGASVVLRSAGGGSREVPLDQLITGPGKTVVRRDEILTAIRVPRPAGRAGGSYQKMFQRQAMDITIAGVAAQLALDKPAGAVTSVRIFAASVAPVPLRLPAAERAVAGKPLTAATLRAAAAAASQEVAPIDDLRGAAWYRRHVSGVLARRALEGACRRAEEVAP